jgi:hypothetical protein
MTENIKVDPTPIQRNKFDVTLELLDLHLRRSSVNADQLQELFAKYYALATYCENMSPENLQALLSEELLEKVGRFEAYNVSF